MRATLAACAFLAVLLSCGSTVLEPARYEKSCVAAGQCRPVTLGDVCAACACANAAVNDQGFGKYEADRKAISCPPRVGVVCAPCPQPLVTCEDGGCVLSQ